MRRALTCLLFAVIACTGCAWLGGGDEITGTSATAETACLADQLGELGGPRSGIPRCEGEPDACVATCLEGGAAGCLGAAFTLEQSAERARESTDLFRRACAGGLAIGCTNYGAHLVTVGETTERDRACAAKLFRRSCSAGEAFACGMSGRLAFEHAQSDDDRVAAGEALEAACRDVGSFACRVLAKHIEDGDYGEASPELIAELLKRACETGDFNACGEPETAGETFQ